MVEISPALLVMEAEAENTPFREAKRKERDPQEGSAGI